MKDLIEFYSMLINNFTFLDENNDFF